MPLAAIAALSACETSKSANPLSPTVAGPIPGVNITQPKLLEPGNGWQVGPDKQPLTLLIENASTNGVRPLKYDFEVATSPDFGSKAVSTSGVPQGQAGRTSLRLTQSLATGRTYYWHARAEDGANTGAFSAPVSFVLLAPVSFGQPVPLSPVNGETTSLTPTLRFRNAPRSGSVGTITYIIDMSRNAAFTALFWNGQVRERSGDTSLATGGLPANTTVFWRVRATDPGHQGPWSATAQFVTGGAPAPPPSPTPPPPPPGGGGGGGNCASRDGNYIASCISAKYPSYLRAGVSSDQRKQNMAFLRDRMIEAAICGGLDVGWNLKRGGPELSIDFVAERTGGTTIGHDIASDYDNTSHPLKLGWSQWPRGQYKAFSPRPSCH